MPRHLTAFSLALALSANAASAAFCDYKPSALVGPAGTAVVTGGTGVVAGAAAGLKAAGVYVLTHAGSGMAMLGSTAGGASAAGTVGIMGGTVGVGAATIGVVLNPFVWGLAAATAVGTVAYEGGCYFVGE